MKDAPGFEGTWGARLRGDGSTVFRLWAPALGALRLPLLNEWTQEMERRDGGWFEVTLDGLAAGQSCDVYGPSLRVDSAFDWQTPTWRGRPWEEAVIYELRTGTFSPEGDFDGDRRRLDGLTTGGNDGYYKGFADDPIGHLARALSEGFAYQGEPYPPWGSMPRGVPSAAQPPTAFVDFIRNHDRTGNRAFGERLTMLTGPETVELFTTVLLLNPQIPLLFMGEEFAETRSFFFFTDFHDDLAEDIRIGRPREFATFGGFDEKTNDVPPDLNAIGTVAAAALDWAKAESEAGRNRSKLISRLIILRRRIVVPRLHHMHTMRGAARRLGEKACSIAWRMDGTFRALSEGDRVARCVMAGITKNEGATA